MNLKYVSRVSSFIALPIMLIMISFPHPALSEDGNDIWNLNQIAHGLSSLNTLPITAINLLESLAPLAIQLSKHQLP